MNYKKKITKLENKIRKLEKRIAEIEGPAQSQQVKIEINTKDLSFEELKNNLLLGLKTL